MSAQSGEGAQAGLGWRSPADNIYLPSLQFGGVRREVQTRSAAISLSLQDTEQNRSTTIQQAPTPAYG